MEKIAIQSYGDGTESVRPLICGYAVLMLFFLLLTVLGGCGGEDGGSSSDTWTITLAITNATSTDVQLSVTASFNAFGTPVWRTDMAWYIATIDLQSNTPYTYIDSNVNPGTQYCYRAGGNFFLLGPIYSNKECVTTPMI